MTVAEMLVLAHWCSRCCEEGSDGEKLGRAVEDLLGEGSTCGVEPFEILDGELVIGDTNCLDEGGRLSPAGARELARLLLRGADDAEADR